MAPDPPRQPPVSDGGEGQGANSIWRHPDPPRVPIPLQVWSCWQCSEKTLQFLSPCGDFVRHTSEKPAARCGRPPGNSRERNVHMAKFLYVRMPFRFGGNLTVLA